MRLFNKRPLTIMEQYYQVSPSSAYWKQVVCQDRCAIIMGTCRPLHTKLGHPVGATINAWNQSFAQSDCQREAGNINLHKHTLELAGSAVTTIQGTKYLAAIQQNKNEPPCCDLLL